MSIVVSMLSMRFGINNNDRRKKVLMNLPAVHNRNGCDFSSKSRFEWQFFQIGGPQRFPFSNVSLVGTTSLHLRQKISLRLVLKF